MLSSVIEFCLESESKLGGALSGTDRSDIPDAQFRRIVERLEETATWDQLHFYGSRVITGDLVSLRVGIKTYRKAELKEMTGGSPIWVRWTRNWFWGLVKVSTGIGSLGRLDAGPSPDRDFAGGFRLISCGRRLRAKITSSGRSRSNFAWIRAKLTRSSQKTIPTGNPPRPPGSGRFRLLGRCPRRL